MTSVHMFGFCFRKALGGVILLSKMYKTSTKHISDLWRSSSSNSMPQVRLHNISCFDPTLQYHTISLNFQGLGSQVRSNVTETAVVEVEVVDAGCGDTPGGVDECMEVFAWGEVEV